MTIEEIKALLEKATPGPWLVEYDPDPDEVYFANGSYDIGPAMVGNDCPNDASNAALIAAAPELAALVIQLVGILGDLVPVAHDAMWKASNWGIGYFDPDGAVAPSRDLLKTLGVRA